jgi:hypothetical protein
MMEIRRRLDKFLIAEDDLMPVGSLKQARRPDPLQAHFHICIPCCAAGVATSRLRASLHRQLTPPYQRCP